uniref:Uncharacterized protein n=1 Tax=Ignisphaera aggregans TaxID=334771 RepID=A0A7J3Z8L0_9CREN
MSKTRKVRVYRQGDVVLEEVYVEKERLLNWECVGSKLEVRSENGSTHTLSAKVFRLNRQEYVLVEGPAVMEHPQHPPIVIEPGVYVVRFVRDWLLRERVTVD